MLTRLVLFLLLFTTAQLQISDREAERAGRRVWLNECSGSVSGLTSWNQGEDFASLGIGHFIWYPVGETGPFDESFPKLVRFLVEQKAPVPAWLAQAKGCPWPDRASFLADFHGPRLTELRRLLSSTVSLQARFMAQRLQAALPRILEKADNPERIEARFQKVFAAPGGLYALLDYVNFKGEGIKETERYKGQGWGLLQVLDGMDERELQAHPLDAFAHSAERMMVRRVRNSPPERHEERWLTGWKNRIHTYQD